jgi:hypothetical protein
MYTHTQRRWGCNNGGFRHTNSLAIKTKSGMRSPMVAESYPDLQRHLMFKLVEVIQHCRPLWSRVAVEGFATQVEIRVHETSESLAHYCQVLQERIARLGEMAVADGSIESTEEAEAEAEAERRSSDSMEGVQKPSRRDSIQGCVEVLGHACRCTNDHCGEASCRKMKEVIEHSTRCEVVAPHCGVCRQLAVLCRMHAAECCDGAGCVVPRCQHLKRELTLAE